MKLLNDCKVQEKATEEDVQMFLNQKKPESKSGKCLMACIYEKTGGVSSFLHHFILFPPISNIENSFLDIFVSQIKDGKIDANVIKQSLMDSGEKAVPNEVIEECQSIANADR